MLFLKKLDKYKAYLAYIYAYYVMPSRKFSDVLVLILNSSQRLPNFIFKNEIFYNNNLKKCPNEQFCRIRGAFWGNFVDYEEFCLFLVRFDNQQGTDVSLR